MLYIMSHFVSGIGYFDRFCGKRERREIPFTSAFESQSKRGLSVEKA